MARKPLAAASKAVPVAPPSKAASTVARPALLQPGVFHSLNKGEPTIVAAANSLDALIKANPGGLKEQPLLDWFGESEERIALFALGLPNQSYVPTHVAREITIKNFRADFACLYLETAMGLSPRLLLIEAQGALHNSVFESKGRITPLWSKDFLSGFAQVVDWHCFKGEIGTWTPLTKLVAGYAAPVQVDFAVIAGLNADVADQLSQQRMNHWTEHVRIGNNLHISTFDALPARTISFFNRMNFIASLP